MLSFVASFFPLRYLLYVVARVRHELLAILLARIHPKKCILII
jgi:hypothetical protein